MFNLIFVVDVFTAVYYIPSGYKRGSDVDYYSAVPCTPSEWTYRCIISLAEYERNVNNMSGCIDIDYTIICFVFNWMSGPSVVR